VERELGCDHRSQFSSCAGVVAAAAELVLVFKLATEIAPDFVLLLGAQMVVFL
jgi:hypothetical protein